MNFEYSTAEEDVVDDLPENSTTSPVELLSSNENIADKIIINTKEQQEQRKTKQSKKKKEERKRKTNNAETERRN